MWGAWGGGTPDFKWRGCSNGGNNQNPKESLGQSTPPPKKKIPGASNKTPKKSMDQKLTPQKSHAVLPSLKSLKVTYCILFSSTIFAELRGQEARALPQIFKLFWIPPKKSLRKSSYRCPKKYLPYFPCQKNPRIENFKPKISFNHPRHLQTEVPDHPRRPPFPWEQGSFAL